MGKKEYILKQAEEAERRRKGQPEKPYNPGGMNSERMPFGCWIWILILVGPAIFAVMNLIGVLH